MDTQWYRIIPGQFGVLRSGLNLTSLSLNFLYLIFLYRNFFLYNLAFIHFDFLTIEPFLHETWSQFHQRSTRSFYVRKLHTQLFCAYILGLHFTGVSLPAQKLHVER